jgi:hypothetical protein
MAPELVRCPTQSSLLRYAGAASDSSLQSAGSTGSTANSSSMTAQQQQQQQQAMRRYDARKVDAWALGVLLYVLVCAQYPFSVSERPPWHQAGSFRSFYFYSVCVARTLAVRAGWACVSSAAHHHLATCGGLGQQVQHVCTGIAVLQRYGRLLQDANAFFDHLVVRSTTPIVSQMASLFRALQRPLPPLAFCRRPLLCGLAANQLCAVLLFAAAG